MHMLQRVFAHIITLFFAVAFLIPRIVDLHVLNHQPDDDTTSCELCDILIQSDQFDLIFDDILYFQDQPYNTPSSFIVITKYNVPQKKIVSPTSIYNKPPPFI